MSRECSTCVLVAQSGRIRLTERRALYLKDLLMQERYDWMLQRRVKLDTGRDPKTENGQVKEIDALLGEIERTIVEMGWDFNDQP